MKCRKCGADSSVYRTKPGARIIIRDRRCAKCGEGWETNEKEVPGTRYATGVPPVSQIGATNSTPVAQGQRADGAPVATGGRGGLPPDQSLTCRSRSDSESDPSLADLPASARDGVDLTPVAPDQRRWPAEEWFEGFRIAWITYSGSGSYGGRPNDWRGTGDMREILRKLTLQDALAAQARAQSIFAAFFTDDDATLVKAAYPWCWFVQRFDALRLPRSTRRSATRSEGNVTVLNQWLAKKVSDDA